MYFKMTNFSCTRIVLVFIAVYSETISSLRAQQLDLEEGDVCGPEADGHASGHVCKRPKNCASLEEHIRRQIYPRICSFVGHEPIVCCSPAANETTTNRPIPMYSKPAAVTGSYTAEEMCRQYSKLVYTNTSNSLVAGTGSANGEYRTLNCHNVLTLIVGGSKAKPKEFPHMALIGYGDKTDVDRTWGCGGSLISNRWIMSAAHCAKSSRKTASWARLGDLNIISDADDARPKEYDIAEIVTHPDYDPSYVYNDIGLFRLETDVQFSAYVRPICLNTNPSLRFKTASATGWGRNGLRGQTSADLLKVNVMPVPFNQCKLNYPPSSRINLGLIEEQMLCAGDFNDGTKDTCTGDSGGPLQVQNANYVCMHTQIGITSFGKYCGSKDTAGVYTRVSHYIPWIERIVWPKF